VAREKGRQVVGAEQRRHRDRDVHAPARRRPSPRPRRTTVGGLASRRPGRGPAGTRERAGHEADERVGAALVEPPLLPGRAVHRYCDGLDGGHDLRGVLGRQVGRQVRHRVVDGLDAHQPIAARGATAPVGAVGVVHDLRPAHPLADLRHGELLDLRQHLPDRLATPVVGEPAGRDERLGLAPVDDPGGHRVGDLGDAGGTVRDGHHLPRRVPRRAEPCGDGVHRELVLGRAAGAVEQLAQHARGAGLRPGGHPLPGRERLHERVVVGSESSSDARRAARSGPGRAASSPAARDIGGTTGAGSSGREPSCATHASSTATPTSAPPSGRKRRSIIRPSSRSTVDSARSWPATVAPCSNIRSILEDPTPAHERCGEAVPARHLHEPQTTTDRPSRGSGPSRRPGAPVTRRDVTPAA
jgi:hypothetical protein